MRVECITNCDADLGGGNRKAMFEGQVYDLPLELAQPLIEAGVIRAVKEKKAEEPAEDKAEEPAKDKAVKGPSRTKSRRSRA